MTNYSKDVFLQLLKYNYTIAFAESMTGGALASNLVLNAGASDVIGYSVVTYSDQVKIKHLNINPMLIDIHGVVSNVIAMEMAKSVRQIAESNIGVGITGNAGPTATGNAQVGEIWVAVDYLGEVYSYHLQLKQLSREEVIEQTVKVVYSMLNQLLKK